MININCKENCIHQDDGKCTFESVVESIITVNDSKCLYYKNCKNTKKV